MAPLDQKIVGEQAAFDRKEVTVVFVLGGPGAGELSCRGWAAGDDELTRNARPPRAPPAPYHVMPYRKGNAVREVGQGLWIRTPVR